MRSENMPTHQQLLVRSPQPSLEPVQYSGQQCRLIGLLFTHRTSRFSAHFQISPLIHRHFYRTQRNFRIVMNVYNEFQRWRHFQTREILSQMCFLSLCTPLAEWPCCLSNTKMGLKQSNFITSVSNRKIIYD